MEKELFENGRKKKKVPKYYGLRIYLVSTMLYFFLVMPIVGILFLKYSPDLFELAQSPQIISENDSISELNQTLLYESKLNALANNQLPISGDSINLITDHVSVSNLNSSTQNDFSLNAAKSTSENKIFTTLTILLKLLLLGFLIGLAFNLPFKIYFKKKRKNY